MTRIYLGPPAHIRPEVKSNARNERSARRIFRVDDISGESQQIPKVGASLGLCYFANAGTKPVAGRVIRVGVQPQAPRPGKTNG
eukprot:gene2218-biopygen7945